LNSSPFYRPCRIPPEWNGIQVNFCKNPTCPNFGVPPHESGSAAAPDSYRLVSMGQSLPALRCKHCGETPPIKSNRAVAEELARMLDGIPGDRLATCPNEACANHAVAIDAPRAYQRFGTTVSGSVRYRCKVCKRLFSVAQEAGLRQRQSDKNRMIFTLLVNKSPMRRICKVLEIGPETLYQRIGFFYDQCRAFVVEQERQLLSGALAPQRLYVAVDRQDYMINWSNQSDRRNVQLHAVGSADLASGYVFGLHLDFDHTLDSETVEADAAAQGDTAILHAYRRYARVWLRADYNDAVRGQWKRLREQAKARKKLVLTSPPGVVGNVATTYAELDLRDDVEAGDQPDYDTRLPARGMQVHSEYTLYGHFYFLEQMFRGVGKVRFYLDQESGIRAACLAALQRRIKAREIDAFYVRINKEFTVNERRRAKARADAAFEREKTSFPNRTDREVELHLIQQRIAALAAIGKWNDRWLVHPFPSMSEPEKAVCYLTDFGDYVPDQIARLYRRASLHAIDRFFMQLRRSISLLERPIQTASAARRIWHGYSPYNPEVVVKLLEIYRVYYNYVQVGEDDKTPAMRLGLAAKPVGIEELLAHVPAAQLKAAA
jgi:transposase-like protein